MKIALVCAPGGHLTQMLFIIEAFEGHEIFFITNKNPRTNQLKYRKYLIENIGTDIRKMAKGFLKIFTILKKEKPDFIISTGGVIAIPAIIISRLMRFKSIYIESWSRVKTKSGTGRILYYFSNHFLVQWPDLVKKYGKKAIYKGAVI
jgi:UDP-N-acetylglucosamine:LPS N-acetylglucosamine transferase